MIALRAHDAILSLPRAGPVSAAGEWQAAAAGAAVHGLPKRIT